MSQPRNPSWLYFPKLPYILQAYRHTCLQRNEAGERVSSRMVGIGKSVLFPQAHLFLLDGKQQLLDVLVGLHGFLAIALLWLL